MEVCAKLKKLVLFSIVISCWDSLVYDTKDRLLLIMGRMLWLLRLKKVGFRPLTIGFIHHRARMSGIILQWNFLIWVSFFMVKLSYN